MVPTWLFQTLTTLVASGAALHPACDMLWVAFTPGVQGRGHGTIDLNIQLACSAVGGNILWSALYTRPA